MKEGPQCSHCGEPCRWQAALSRHRKLVMQVGSLAGRTCRGLPDCHPPPRHFLTKYPCRGQGRVFTKYRRCAKGIPHD